MWNIKSDGNMYQGDLQYGDRIATHEEELNKQLSLEKTIKIMEAKKYLSDTSWYVERFNDPSSGKPIPQEILDKRAEAREIINSLEG